MKIKGFDIDIRPLKDPASIPISEFEPSAVQFRHDGVLLNDKLYPWETLLSVKISPILDKDLLYTVELNSGHIDIYENSVIFHDDIKEDCWEYDWKELFRSTKEDFNP